MIGLHHNLASKQTDKMFAFCDRTVASVSYYRMLYNVHVILNIKFIDSGLFFNPDLGLEQFSYRELQAFREMSHFRSFVRRLLHY